THDRDSPPGPSIPNCRGSLRGSRAAEPVGARGPPLALLVSLSLTPCTPENNASRGCLHLRVTAILGVSLSLAGCAVTASLSAKPDSVCAGRAVRLRWDASQSGKLTAEPPDESLGDVPASGVRTVRPKQTTTYKLRASSLFSSQEIESTVKIVSVPS